MSPRSKIALADSHRFGIILDLLFGLQELFCIEREILESWRPRGEGQARLSESSHSASCRIRRAAPLTGWIREGPEKEVEAGFHPLFVPSRHSCWMWGVPTAWNKVRKSTREVLEARSHVERWNDRLGLMLAVRWSLPNSVSRKCFFLNVGRRQIISLRCVHLIDV